MAVDINEEVRAWGGFSVTDFWTGVMALVLIVAVGLFIALNVSGILGGVWVAFAGGSFAALWVYRLTLPKGYLLRRFQQEGKFLFFKIPGIEGLKVQLPAAHDRGARFRAEFEEEGNNGSNN